MFRVCALYHISKRPFFLNQAQNLNEVPNHIFLDQGTIEKVQVEGHDGVSYQLIYLSHLPLANAILNSLSAFCLIAGYMAIKTRKRELHLKFMLSALTFSFLFLVSYLIYHTFHGDTLYEGEGLMRIFYFFILISHIFLSAVVLPMILTTVYFAVTGNFARHPRIARITLPMWLYVSVTGVMIYLIL